MTVIRRWNGTEWEFVSTPNIPEIEPSNPQDGDLWLDPDAGTINGFTIGQELAYAERTSNITSTATSAAAPELIPGLAIDVEGIGRPVLVEFYCNARHATVDFKTAVVIACEGGLVTPSGLGGVNTTVATQSATLYAATRIIIPDGFTYTFEVGMWGATGTKTYEGSVASPMWLAATQR